MKDDDNENKIIEASVARVEGAVRVASVDDVEALKSKSNDTASNRAIKKMQTETKKGIATKNK